MSNITGHFFRRRWLDFRNGHGLYLAFVMSFTNFILIGYNFAVKKAPFLSDFFDNTIVFALVFIGFYIPVAMIIGYYHRRKQYVVEAEVGLQENWPIVWILRYQIRLIQGETTPEENKRMLTYLDNILKRHKKEDLMFDDETNKK
ncbi:MAG: hypothetical protein K5790_09715 [Nitrosopumilus sp.]|uniref:hypothetical protein n=1 Tax=Nitrosopumilus sp. TaxID=2024843 RepID=UPI00247CFA20|nr:hypothetical protein [Nitrosopumilus sp.]MCV0393547.1 hypothetical protein [Nitrosopumilus sp.]